MSEERKSQLILQRTALGIAFVALVFTLVVASLMGAARYQMAATPSLNLPEIERLRSDLRDQPDNENVRSSLRSLDLLARRAHFANITTLEAGGRLLLAGLATLLAALGVAVFLGRATPDPRKVGAVTDEWQLMRVPRWSVALTGVALLVAAIMSKPSHRQDKVPAAAVVPVAAVSEYSQKMSANWPGFRGPGGSARAASGSYAQGWNGKTGSNVLWKTRIPMSGYNSPICWEDRVFVTGADKDNREVYGLDATSGEIVFTCRLPPTASSGGKVLEVTEDTGYAASTPATDGLHVFAAFANGDLVACDFEGKIAWIRSLGLPDVNYGYASSLVTDGKLLFVQLDSRSGGRLMAIDVASGATAWDRKRDGIDNSWASPILVNTGTREELILNASPVVAGYEPSTGNELWRVTCMANEIAASPAYAAGKVYVANEWVKLVAIKADGAHSIAWEYGEDLPNVSSPVATESLVFMASAGGIVSCVDAGTGKLNWKHEFPAGFYSSPQIADGRVYVTDMNGVTRIIAESAVFSLINEPDLGEDVTTTPAFHAGRIYMRGKKNLYCLVEGAQANVDQQEQK